MKTDRITLLRRPWHLRAIRPSGSPCPPSEPIALRVGDRFPDVFSLHPGRPRAARPPRVSDPALAADRSSEPAL
jgi:hypothetical protein